jgi:hypothetical protein
MVCDCAVRDGPQDLRIQTREAGKIVVLIYMFRSRRIEGECVVGRGLRDTTGDLVAEVSRRIQRPKK